MREQEESIGTEERSVRYSIEIIAAGDACLFE